MGAGGGRGGSDSAALRISTLSSPTESCPIEMGTQRQLLFSECQFPHLQKGAVIRPAGGKGMDHYFSHLALVRIKGNKRHIEFCKL